MNKKMLLAMGIGGFISVLMPSQGSASDINVLQFPKDGASMLISPNKITTPCFTIECWVKLREDAGTVERYFITQNNGGVGRFQMGIKTGRRLQAFMGSRCGWQDSGYDLPIGEWVHVALVQNETGDWVWYVNGAEYKRLELKNTYAPDTGHILTLGKHPTGGATPPVDLSNVRIWSVARTSEQLAANWKRTIEKPEDGLIVSWVLDDIDGCAYEAVSGAKPQPSGASFVAAADHPMSEHPALCDCGDSLGFVYMADGMSFVPTDVTITNSSYTLESWVYFTGKPEGSSSDEWVFFRQYEQSTPGRLSVGIRNGEFAAFVGGYEGWQSSGYAVPTNTWVHLAFVHDGVRKTWKFYANGQSCGAALTGQASVPAAGQRLKLGSEGYGLAFPGRLADIRVWRGVRCASQIATYYNRRLGDALPAELMGYWPIDGRDTAASVMNHVTRSEHKAVNCEKTTETPWLFIPDDTVYEFGLNSCKKGRTVTDMRLPGPSFTIEAWVNYLSTAIDDYEVCICSQYSQGGAEAGRMQLGIKNGHFQAFLGSAGGWQDSGYVVPKNRWKHLAFVRDAENSIWRFFVDGACVAEKSVSGTSYGETSADSVKFTIGGRQYSDAGFVGLISDVRLWNGCRSAADIKSSFNYRQRPKEQGLVGYWRLDDSDADGSGVQNAVTKVRSGLSGACSMELFAKFLEYKKYGMMIIVW